jgi:hypothetical protein
VTLAYKPVAHPTQLSERRAPVVVKYRPAAHGVHAMEPAATAYWPAGHDKHAVLPVVAV